MAIEHLSESHVVVQTAKFANVYVVTASGELDLHGAGLLRTELDRVGEHAGTLIVDLLGVPFVDSAALGVLAGAAKRVRAADGHIVLVCDDPRTIRVFEVTGLDGIFAFERSLSAAIDAAIARSNGGSS